MPPRVCNLVLTGSLASSVTKSRFIRRDNSSLIMAIGKTPLSVEDILAKQKAEKEEASKVECQPISFRFRASFTNPTARSA